MTPSNSLVLAGSLVLATVVGAAWLRVVPDPASGLAAGLLAGLGALMVGGVASAHRSRPVTDRD